MSSRGATSRGAMSRGEQRRTTADHWSPPVVLAATRVMKENSFSIIVGLRAGNAMAAVTEQRQHGISVGWL